MQPDMNFAKELGLAYHAEKLAVAFGPLSSNHTNRGTNPNFLDEIYIESLSSAYYIKRFKLISSFQTRELHL